MLHFSINYNLLCQFAQKDSAKKIASVTRTNIKHKTRIINYLFSFRYGCILSFYVHFVCFVSFFSVDVICNTLTQNFALLIFISFSIHNFLLSLTKAISDSPLNRDCFFHYIYYLCECREFKCLHDYSFRQRIHFARLVP